MRPQLLVALLAPLLFGGCASTLGGEAVPLEGRAVEFARLEDCDGRQGTELHRVVRTAAEWTQVWRQACGDGSVLPVMAADGAAHAPAPAVDFERSLVVASFAGEKATGGYVHRVTALTAFGDRVRVDVDRVRPGPECVVTQGTSYPGDVVVAERFGLPGRFVFRDLVQAC